MSVQAQSWVIKNSKHKGSALLVLLMIANHAHSDGTNAFPSFKLLAEECRMSQRQIIRIVAFLEKSGEITVEKTKGRISNNYAVNMTANPDKLSQSNPDKLSQSTMTNPKANRDISGDSTMTFSHSPIYKEEPLIEPIENTQERVCAAENSAGKEINLTANKKPYGEFVTEFEEWYCGKLGIVQIPPYPDNSENLRWLYTNNFTLPEITAYYDWAKTEKWRTGRVTLGTIAKEIAEFRLKQQKPQTSVYFTTSKPVDVCKLPGLPEMRRAAAEVRNA